MGDRAGFVARPKKGISSLALMSVLSEIGGRDMTTQLQNSTKGDQMEKCKCKRPTCLHEWWARPRIDGKLPEQCPKCKSYKWDEPEKK